MKKFLLLLCTTQIFGCAFTSQKVPVASMEQLKPGNALVSVKRLSEFGGGGRSIEVTDNGEVIGNISFGKSLVWQRSAGTMKLRLTPSFGMVEGEQSITTNVNAGESYDYVIFLGYNGFQIRKE